MTKRLHDEGPRDGDASLSTAGQGAGVDVCPLGQTRCLPEVLQHGHVQIFALGAVPDDLAVDQGGSALSLGPRDRSI
jgi:hypothetical protein